jgi:hypothetical protein
MTDMTSPSVGLSEPMLSYSCCPSSAHARIAEARGYGALSPVSKLLASCTHRVHALKTLCDLRLEKDDLREAVDGALPSSTSRARAPSQSQSAAPAGGVRLGMRSRLTNRCLYPSQPSVRDSNWSTADLLHVYTFIWLGVWSQLQGKDELPVHDGYKRSQQLHTMILCMDVHRTCKPQCSSQQPRQYPGYRG